MASSSSRRNAAPRLEISVIQGWRAEFRLWWAMTKHVDVVFDKSSASLQHLNLPNATPGSISMCRGCCQIVSTRMCSGKTQETASGCAFHRNHPDVPIAVRSIITSTRLREMLKPRMIVERYYLRVAPIGIEPVPEEDEEDMGEGEADDDDNDDDNDDNDENEQLHEQQSNYDNENDEARIQTNLMNVGWVRRIRLGNKETKRSKKVYLHDKDGGCIHSNNPDFIVQGFGPRHLYFKRCDGCFVNAFGEMLEKATLAAGSNTAQEEPTVCEKESASGTSPSNSQQENDDITPVPEIKEEVEDENEGDNAEFCQKSNPWANVVIDTIVKTDPEDETSAGSNRDEKDSHFQTDSDAIATGMPSPPPRSSSYRRTLTTPISPPNVSHASSSSSSATSSRVSLSLLVPMPMPVPSPSPSSKASPPPLPANLDMPEVEMAKLAWRHHNIPVAQAEDHEEVLEREARRRHTLARKRRWFLLWLR